MELDGREVSKMVHDIIVIGASAGGIEALKMLVAELPGDLRAALFLVQHVSAKVPSVLPRMLSRWGPLPALHATEGMRIEQGKIYVAPPSYHLLLEQGSVHLGTGPKEWYVRPAADVLFRSAASAYGSRVVGVVLTGRGGDGTAGLQAVKRSGGVTVVQDPTDAACSSMPQSALKQGEIDYTLPLLCLASLLIHLVESSL
jgi:two-component system chemotaxis response regulator CheB